MKIEFDLLSNAEDSIQQAIELVAWGGNQSEPRRLKQAVQSIAHGVELLLKERLKRVHPCLIWENVDKYQVLTLAPLRPRLPCQDWRASVACGLRQPMLN